jgi:enediyne biosynthesis protein E5
MPARLAAASIRDPRLLQIAFLGSFLCAGLTVLHFDLQPWQPVLIVATALGTQWGMTRLMKVPPAGYLSPLISSFGLSLLLRSDVWWIPPFAAAVAISSKFLIRFRGKHIFNPTNLGLAAAMLVSDRAWCSPSQWGESAVVIAWFAIFGLAVAHRAFRSDVSIYFFGAWLLLKLGRVLYLGQRLPVLWHQLSTGSLILFTFFMISDPKTTPDSRFGRAIYACVVAGLAFYLQHGLWKTNTLIWALLAVSPLVPLIDWLFKGQRYRWPGQSVSQATFFTSGRGSGEMKFGRFGIAVLGRVFAFITASLPTMPLR